MENSQQPATHLDFVGLLNIISKWKKQLIITGLLAAVAAFIVTRPFIMAPLFKSTAVVYPANIAPYSTESTTETMLQFIQSDDVRELFISKMNLHDHYKIDKKDPLARSYLALQLNEKLQISRTQYESIEITAWDTDPVFAAAMCDSLISANDSIVRKLQREKVTEVVTMFENKLALSKAEMDSAENALKLIREQYGIISFEAQAKEISKVIYKKNSVGNGFVQEQYKNLKEHGGEEFALTEHLFRLRGFYNDIKKDYNQAIVDRIKLFTYTTVVTKAVPAEVKSSPKGTLIILGSTAAALFFALLVVVIIESYRKNTNNTLAV